MAKKSVKSSIEKEVFYARKWSKIYVQGMIESIEQGEFEEALSYARQLAPVWGEIETTLEELIEEQEQ